MAKLFQFTITGAVTAEQESEVRDVLKNALDAIRDLKLAQIEISVQEKTANFESFIKKKSAIPVNLFGPTTMQTRYCPDHPSVMVTRVTDSIYQCPVDGATYDYRSGFETEDGKQYTGGSVAEQTPESAEFYQSPRRLLR